MTAENASKSEEDGSDTPEPDEIDDQFRSLMEGLRTTIPGVTVLFSFLLIVPFQSVFGEISSVDVAVYYLAFALSAISAVLLIAPSVHQRVRAPISGIKRRTLGHVMAATKLAIAGTVAFLLAIATVVYLVSSIVFEDLWASVASAVVAAIAGWAWFYLPLVRFERDDI